MESPSDFPWLNSQTPKHSQQVYAEVFSGFTHQRKNIEIRTRSSHRSVRNVKEPKNCHRSFDRTYTSALSIKSCASSPAQISEAGL
jgi:hypothetical protein